MRARCNLRIVRGVGAVAVKLRTGNLGFAYWGPRRTPVCGQIAAPAELKIKREVMSAALYAWPTLQRLAARSRDESPGGGFW